MTRVQWLFASVAGAFAVEPVFRPSDVNWRQVAGHQVPDPAGENGEVISETCPTVEILRVSLHARAVVVLDGVDLREHLAVRCVDPVDPARREALRLDAVEVAPALGVDHDSSGALARRADVAGRLLEGRSFREFHRVPGRRDRWIVRTYDRPHGTGCIPVDTDLAAENERAGGAVHLLIALVRSAAERKLPDELHVGRNRVARRRAPTERLERSGRRRGCPLRSQEGRRGRRGHHQDDEH